VEGLEYFTSLEKLHCSNNRIMTLDMSYFPSLRMLDCSHNKLHRLNVDANPQLIELECSDNNLITLNVSHNPALQTLGCNSIRLIRLDVSRNPALQVLKCGNNHLSVLDIMNNRQLTITEQGSFFAGGKTIKQQGVYNTSNPMSHDGQTFHGDHVYVSYQKPVTPNKFPLVFLHGAGQSGKTWETTPDGREGFGTIFLRRGFSTYIVDQPRRGRAGNSTVNENIQVLPNDQFWFENFRMGIYPNLFEGSQFPKDSESLNQFLCQITPNTGAYDLDVISSAMSAAIDRIGEAVLITHSQGGGPGWQTVLKNPTSIQTA